MRVPDHLRTDWRAAQGAEAEFRKSGALVDLNACLRSWENLIETAEGACDSRIHAGFQNARNILLVEHFKKTNDERSLERSIESWNRLVRETEPSTSTAEEDLHRGTYLGNLGSALHLSFEHEPAKGKIDRAIDLLEQACESPGPSGVPSLDFYRLSTALKCRFQYRMDAGEDDLGRAIEMSRKAVDREPSQSPRYLAFLTHLGTALVMRHRQERRMSDLEEGLDILKRCTSATRVEDPSYPLRAAAWGQAFIQRFLIAGDMGDLRRAIALLDEAVSRPLDGPFQAATLADLGVARCLYFDSSRHPADLDQGLHALIESIRISQDTWGGAAGLAHYVQALGFGLMRRWSATGDPKGLIATIEILEATLRSLSAQSHIGPLIHATLSHAYASRARHELLDAWADAAVMHGSSAMEKLPVNHRDRFAVGISIADGLRMKYEIGRDPTVLEAAVEGFRTSSDMLLEHLPAQSIESALAWADWAFERESWDEAQEAYARVFSGLGMVLERQLARPGREAWLGRIQGLASRAAYAAARAGDLEMSVLALEQGHARMLVDRLRWTEAATDSLRQQHPELWQAYRTAVDELIEWERRLVDIPLPLPGRPSPKSGYEDPECHAERLRGRLGEVLNAVRANESFADFARPSGFDDVRRAVRLYARSCPNGEKFKAHVVYIATTTAGTLVLWLDSREVGHFFLSPALHDFEGRLGPAPSTQSGTYEAPTPEMLNEVGARIMAPIAERLGRRGASDIVLVPVGPLGGLPLQMAPIPKAQEDGEASKSGSLTCLGFEHTVSFQPNGAAFAASLRALETIRTDRSRKRMLIVGEKGLASVIGRTDSATAEAAGSQIELIELPIGVEGTRDRVFEELPRATHVHFGCHGMFDPAALLASGLDLGPGERLTLNDLLHGPIKWLPPELVVLAACESGVRDQSILPDEIMSLAGGLLQNGVSAVIATLWKVDTAATGLLMVRFYELLLGSELPAAEALASAQQWLRNVTLDELVSMMEQLSDARAAWAEQAIVAHGLGAERPFEAQEHWAGFLLIGNPR